MRPRSSSARPSSNRSSGGGRPPARGGKPSGGRPTEAPRSFYGVLEISPKGNFVRPTSRQQKFSTEISKKDLNNAMDGEIVFVSRKEEPAKPGKKARLGDFAVVKRLGSSKDVRNYSLLSALEAGLQPQFPPKIVDAGYEFTVPELGTREDLRDLPLVTIDGADARDFDDAVYARPADDGNGWYAIIAIADVAHYVREGELLDKEALRRGNSTYFPDRVIPMLPERLSNDLCSLRPYEDRACMHVHVWIDENGQIADWNIGRGLMRSAARLTYEQVQKALDGQPDETTTPVLEQLQYLYKTFQVLLKAREERNALEINSPERRIMLDEEGGVAAVLPKERLEAHQLIEELMITANVVVATALEAKSAPCMYRVHDTPSAYKVATLGQFIKPLGMDMPKESGEIAPALFNTILRKVKEMPDLSPVINDLVLRSQAQAVYDPENMGHFGLALEKYAHFTSPIRRYADLINHRSLIAAYELGDDGLKPNDKGMMAEWAEQISTTERASMLAERSCVDRFTAHFLQTQIGKELTGRITSVTSFGLFVSLLDGVGEALVPMRMLPQDFYDFIEEKQILVGGRSGRVYRLGGRVTLHILGVDPILGSVTAQLIGEASADLPGFEDDDHARPAPAPREFDRPRRDSRDRDDRPRAPRRDDRDDKPRPPYRGGRDAKPAFSKEKPRREDEAPSRYAHKEEGEKPKRSFSERDSRPAYKPRENGADRAKPRFERPERPRGEFDPPKRSYGDRDRPQGDRDSRPAYKPRDGGSDRPKPRYDRDERPRPPREGGDDRPKRSYGAPSRPQGDKPRGGEPSSRGRSDASSRDSRPAYKPREGGAERPRYNDDRPKRSYGDRPQSGERPHINRDGNTSYNPRPPREGDDRPKRAYAPKPAGDRKPYGDRKPSAPRNGGSSYGGKPKPPSGGRGR